MSEWVPLSDKLSAIRKLMKSHCKGLSMRMSRGTGYGWVHIRGNADDFGHLSEEQETFLKSIGLKTGLNFNIAKDLLSPDDLDNLYHLWIEQGKFPLQ